MPPREGHAPSRLGNLAHLPQKPLGGGEDSDGSQLDDAHPARRRRPPPPAPFPRKLHGGRGEFDCAPSIAARVTSPPRSLWGRGRERGAPAARTHTIRDTPEPRPSGA